MTRRRLVVHGMVQGVGYRWSMSREARRLGVSGWVRNRADGSVEAVVHGTPAAVEAMTRWAKHGPEQARVERVDAYPAEGAFASFEKQPTA